MAHTPLYESSRHGASTGIPHTFMLGSIVMHCVLQALSLGSLILVRNWGPFSGTEFWLHKGGDPQCLGPRRVVEGEHQRVQQNRTTRAQIVIYFVTFF